MEQFLHRAYERLDPPEKRLCEGLIRYPGPFVDVAISAAVLDTDSEKAAFEVLAKLVLAGLVVTAGKGHFRVPEWVRGGLLGCAQQEGSADERDAEMERIAGHYLRRAAAAGSVLLGEGWLGTRDPQPDGQPVEFNPQTALGWMKHHLPNLVAVQRAMAEGGLHHHMVWQICEALWAFFEHRGHLSEWFATTHLAIVSAHQASDWVAKARMLIQLGALYLRRGMVFEAGVLFVEAFTLARSASDAETVAVALAYRGDIARRTCDFSQAVNLYTVAQDVAEEGGQGWRMADLGHRLGEVYHSAGEPEKALAALGEARRIITELDGGDSLLAARISTTSGAVNTTLREFRSARRELHWALRWARGVGAYHHTGTVCELLAELARSEEETHSIRLWLEKALLSYYRYEPGSDEVQRVQSRLGVLDPTQADHDQRRKPHDVAPTGDTNGSRPLN